MRICIYEDRPNAIVGVKLLLLSLRSYCPEVPVFITYALADGGFRAWARRCPQATTESDPALRGQGWNTKPLLLLRALNAGADEVVWLDSDVILSADFRPLLQRRRADEIVVAQEQYWGLYQGSSVRTGLWGLEPGRVLPFTANSGFVRVTAAHRELLNTWKDFLARPEYREAQKLQPMHCRPLHLQGDQDVLTALLGAAAFRNIPVVYLRRGREIVQSIGPAGYTIGERIRNLGSGLPPLIHGVHPKPWNVVPQRDDQKKGRNFASRISMDTSPYSWVARRYLHELEEEVPGLRIQTVAGRVLHGVALGNPTLSGFVPAAIHSIGKRLKRLLGLTPWPRSIVRAELEARRHPVNTHEIQARPTAVADR